MASIKNGVDEQRASLNLMRRSPYFVRSATTSTAARSASGGTMTEPGVSLPAMMPEVHGTKLPDPRMLVVAGSSAHLSQHCCPHLDESAHATHTLHPRVCAHAVQQASGSRERPRGPYPSLTTAPSKSVCSRTEAHVAFQSTLSASDLLWPRDGLCG
eukprot:scaffold66008_cov33-Tisochrysis_lutea.AAC.2